MDYVMKNKDAILIFTILLVYLWSINARISTIERDVDSIKTVMMLRNITKHELLADNG